ncbi:MAG: GldG family protein [Planctomycetota bacterium]|jgi:ABC-type uncharacterized transport system involved in gliding motility auxiliary subunit
MPEGLTPAGVEGGDSTGLGEQLRVPLAYAAFAALFGLLPLVFVCLFFGAFKTWWALTLFALMGATIVAGVAFNFSQVLEMFTTRRAAAGASVALAVAAGLVILVGVNYISFRRFAAWDLTEDGRFTLSVATRNLVDAVEESGKPLRILSFLPPQASRSSGLPPGYPYLQKVTELLKLYEMSNSISVTITNPVGELNRTEAVAKEIGLTLENIPKDTVVLKWGDKRKDVSVSQIFQTFPMNPYMRQPPPPPIFKGEDAFTSAIRDILDETERKVYFVTGHGERTTGSKAGDYNAVAGGLRGMNFKIDDVNLAGKEAVPEDTSVLVIAGPTAPISEAELTLIESYLDDGGSLFVTLDYLDKRAGHVSSGLERLLRKFGVEVHQDVMAVGQEIVTGRTHGIPHEYHEISEHLSRKTVLLRNACVLKTTSPEKEGFDARGILEGTDGSWGERDLSGRLRYNKDTDIAGPTTLGVAVGPRKSDPSTPFGPTGRAHIVVFADADFLSDRLMADPQFRFAANTDLFLNAVNWMVGKTENIGIQPRERERRAVHMTPVRRTRVFWGAVVLPALAMVVLGIVVWRLRSR